MLLTPARGSKTAAEGSNVVRTTSCIIMGWYNEERHSAIAVEGARTFVLTRVLPKTILARDALISPTKQSLAQERRKTVAVQFLATS